MGKQGSTGLIVAALAGVAAVAVLAFRRKPAGEQPGGAPAAAQPSPQPQPAPAPELAPGPAPSQPAPAPASTAVQVGGRYASPPGLPPPITYVPPGLAAYDQPMLSSYFSNAALASRFFYDSQIRLPSDYFITTGYFWRGDDGRYYELAIAGPGNTWDTMTRQQVPMRQPQPVIEDPLPPPSSIPDPAPVPEAAPTPTPALITGDVFGFEPVDFGQSQPRVRATGRISNSGGASTRYRVDLFAQEFNQFGIDKGGPLTASKEVALDPGRATDFQVALSLSPTGGDYFECWTVIQVVAPVFKVLKTTSFISVENLLLGGSDSASGGWGGGAYIV